MLGKNFSGGSELGNGSGSGVGLGNITDSYPALAGMIGILVIVLLVIIVISVISMWKIFEKAGQAGWKALIPVYNMYILNKIGTGNNMYFFIFIGIEVLSSIFRNNSIINGIASIASLIVAFMIYYGVSKSFGHGVGFTIGTMFLTVIFLPILAFNSDEYIGPNGESDGLSGNGADDNSDGGLAGYTAQYNQSTPRPNPHPAGSGYQAFNQPYNAGNQNYNQQPMQGQQQFNQQPMQGQQQFNQQPMQCQQFNQQPMQGQQQFNQQPMQGQQHMQGQQQFNQQPVQRPMQQQQFNQQPMQQQQFNQQPVQRPMQQQQFNQQPINQNQASYQQNQQSYQQNQQPVRPQFNTQQQGFVEGQPTNKPEASNDDFLNM